MQTAGALPHISQDSSQRWGVEFRVRFIGLSAITRRSSLPETGYDSSTSARSGVLALLTLRTLKLHPKLPLAKDPFLQPSALHTNTCESSNPCMSCPQPTNQRPCPTNTARDAMPKKKPDHLFERVAVSASRAWVTEGIRVLG